jgi:hypothetical protein
LIVAWGATGVAEVTDFNFDLGRKSQIGFVLAAYDITAPPAFFESLEDGISRFRGLEKLARDTRPAAVRKNLQNAIHAGQRLHQLLLRLDDDARWLLRQAASGIGPQPFPKHKRAVRTLRLALNAALQLNNRLNDLDGKSRQLLDIVATSVEPWELAIEMLNRQVGVIVSALSAAARMGVRAGEQMKQGRCSAEKDWSRGNDEGGDDGRLPIEVVPVVSALQLALLRSLEEYPSKPNGALLQNHRFYLALDVAHAIRTHLDQEPTLTKDDLFMEILELVLAAATGKEEHCVHELARRALKGARRIGEEGGLIEYFRLKDETPI